MEFVNLQKPGKSLADKIVKLIEQHGYVECGIAVRNRKSKFKRRFQLPETFSRATVGENTICFYQYIGKTARGHTTFKLKNIKDIETFLTKNIENL